MINRFSNTTFLKNVGTLSSGTIVANFITIGTSFFLTRLFTPSDIGNLSLFSSYTIVMANICTFGYELAIIHPKQNKKAVYLIAGIFSLLFISVSTITILFFFIKIIGINLDIGIPEIWIIFLPISIILMGTINIYQEWYNRTQKYSLLSINKVIQSLLTALPQISLGFLSFGKIGLVIGFLIGRVSSSIIYVINYYPSIDKHFFRAKRIILALIEYKKYPRYISPTLILDRLSLEAPFFLIPFLFNDVMLGFFAIAFRVLSVPLSFFGNALGQVVYKHLTSKRQNSEKLTPSLLKIWMALLSIGVLPMAIIFFGRERLFEFVFGDNWGISGTISVYLIPMLFIDFVSSPTGRTFLVLQLEHLTPIFSIARIIYIVGSLYLGYLYNDFFLGLMALSITRALALIIQNIVLYLQVKRYDLSLN